MIHIFYHIEKHYRKEEHSHKIANKRYFKFLKFDRCKLVYIIRFLIRKIKRYLNVRTEHLITTSLITSWTPKFLQLWNENAPKIIDSVSQIDILNWYSFGLQLNYVVLLRIVAEPDFALSLSLSRLLSNSPALSFSFAFVLASGCVRDINAKNFHFIKTNAAVFEIIKSHKGEMSQRMKNA